MTLTQCSFYRSGKDMNFSVFSDDVCRVHHVQSISLRLGGDVDVYNIEPGPRSHWIVVRQTADGKPDLRWFVRKGHNFEENPDNVPPTLRTEVGARFPQLIPRQPAMVA